MKKIKPSELAAYKQAERESRLEPSTHEVLENLNREGMTSLMAETGMTFPAKEFALWKPTKRSLGQVRGIYGNVLILAHNGLLGLFERAAGAKGGVSYVTAHTGWFDGTIEPLFSFKKETAGVGFARKKKEVSEEKLERARKRAERKNLLLTL